MNTLDDAIPSATAAQDGTAELAPASPQRLILEPEPATSAVRRFIDQMPISVQRSFTSEQLQELSKALTRRHSRGPAVNLHLSFLRYFVVIYGGKEKRSRQRLKIDRLKHRTFSAPNLAALAVIAVGAACTGLTLWRLLTLGTL